MFLQFTFIKNYVFKIFKKYLSQRLKKLKYLK